MTGPDRAAVSAALTAELVSERYGMGLRFRGRWARTRVCPFGAHAAAALAVSRDGRFRCHAHLVGGDLVQLAGAFEGLDRPADLPKLLEMLAEVAGVTGSRDDFGGSAPPPRRAPPPAEPLDARLERARSRAAWLWDRMWPLRAGGERPIPEVEYVRARGLDPDALYRAGEARLGPARISEAECIELAGPRDGGGANLHPIWTTYRAWVEDGFGVVLPVRHVDTGAIVDVRIRRVRPRRDDSPKIQGMLGGCSSHDGELVGCYGHPHDPPTTPTGAAIIVEGAFDYLTMREVALSLPRGAWVLGSVDAGQYAKVAAHAATWCADTGTPLLLVAQEDGPGGAAVRAVDQASVEAVHLGIVREQLRWLECGGHAKDVSAWWQRDRQSLIAAVAGALA